MGVGAWWGAAGSVVGAWWAAAGPVAAAWWAAAGAVAVGSPWAVGRAGGEAAVAGATVGVRGVSPVPEGAAVSVGLALTPGSGASVGAIDVKPSAAALRVRARVRAYA
ncbi:hypothetical protein CQR58_033095 [Streptomyces acidiscabies]